MSDGGERLDWMKGEMVEKTGDRSMVFLSLWIRYLDFLYL